MPLSIRSTAFTAAAAALLVVPGPGAAYAADRAYTLTAAQMAAELKAARPATEAASTDGWRAATTMTGDLTYSSMSVVDLVGGVAYLHSRIGESTFTAYIAEERGSYTELTDPISKKAVAMMKRSHVHYVFTPDKSASLSDVGIEPTTLLILGTRHSGTKTVQDDGSVDYSFKDSSASRTTIHLDSDGLLTRLEGAMEGLRMTTRFSYGRQQLEVPGMSTTISGKELQRGVAYVQMSTLVRVAATEGASTARRKAHGHTIKVSTLRAAVRHAANSINKDYGFSMIKAKNISHGIKLSATNPWTHQSVAYTATVSGRKVTVHKN